MSPWCQVAEDVLVIALACCIGRLVHWSPRRSLVPGSLAAEVARTIRYHGTCGSLVTRKLDTVLCQPAVPPWKRWPDVPSFLLHMGGLPVYASISLGSQVVDDDDLPGSPGSLVPS
jgi:hypothetical protein